MAKRELPSPELLRKLLRYDRRTGKLYWRKRTAALMRVNAHRVDEWNEKHAGKEGFTSIGTHGYYVGSISGYGTLLAHRVIAAMVLGYWPQCVDHDNRVRTDNRWKNLNATTHSGNRKNVPMSRRNTSGVTGVCFVSDQKKWRATINHERQTIRLGDFRKIEDAIAARRAAETAYGYHPRHGRSATGATAARSC